MANYRTQVFDTYADVPRSTWQALWAASLQPTPFTHYDFLHAAQESGSATKHTGWISRPLIVTESDPSAAGEAGRPVAAVPLYQKLHSYGEYVFDWSWARAYEDAGGVYYPKWLIAPPFSPVPGSRVLAAPGEDLAAGIAALNAHIEGDLPVTAHLLFPIEAEAKALAERGWLIRKGVQFHWVNQGYADFEAYLASLTQPRRKKIRAERRKVAEAGITTQVIRGQDASEADWNFFYECYCQTYFEHGNPPYFARTFFADMARDLAAHCALVIASRTDGQRIAAVLLMLQDTPEGPVAYGRYWGAIARVPCLHFEMAYYTPLAWAIDHGITRLEGGAQGEHKLWRGFEPVETCSAHYIRDEWLREGVARFLSREGHGMDHYISELNEHLPFKQFEGQAL